MTEVGRSALFSTVGFTEGYGLQPVHKRLKTGTALAAEGRISIRPKAFSRSSSIVPQTPLPLYQGSSSVLPQSAARFVSGQLFSPAAKRPLLCIRARLQSCRKAPKQSWALAPARHLEAESLHAKYGGSPCFSRGKLDFSPAEKQFILKGRALALAVSKVGKGRGEPGSGKPGFSRSRGTEHRA
jgi:hypothetical protein